MHLNERIKILMNEKHMTQKELAKSAGITEASLSKYMNGTRTPRIDVIVSISRVLGVTTDELIGNPTQDGQMGIVQMKAVLARGMDSISEKDKKELIRFLLEN